MIGKLCAELTKPQFGILNILVGVWVAIAVNDHKWLLAFTIAMVGMVITVLAALIAWATGNETQP